MENNNLFSSWEKNKRVAIFTHVNPDPDAIGSAVGVQWILKKKFGISSDIFYVGEISHPQNKTLINVLSITLKKIEEYECDKSKYQKVILVDCTSQNVGVELSVNVIIDHHRVKIKSEDYEYVDIQQVGSCCSLIYKLINKFNINLEDNEDEESKLVATTMLIGIKTDTNDLLSDNTTDLDHSAYQKLAKCADMTKISAILNYPLPKYLFDIERQALSDDNSKQINAAIISYIGVLTAAKRDCLPILSDKFIRMEGITTALVFSVVEDNIEVSVRSKDVTLDVDAFCKKIFGRDNAGGKYGSGGARIPLGFFSISQQQDNETKEKIAEAIKSIIMVKIEKEITGN